MMNDLFLNKNYEVTQPKCVKQNIVKIYLFILSKVMQKILIKCFLKMETIREKIKKYLLEDQDEKLRECGRNYCFRKKVSESYWL